MKAILFIIFICLGYTVMSQSQNLQGLYQSSGYFFHPTSSRALNAQKNIIRISTNTYQADVADLSGYSFQFTVDASNNLINWTPVGSTPALPASNFMTSDNPGGFSWYPGSTTGFVHSTYNNTYDPVTKTFYLHYGYQSGSTGQIQFQRQIYEKYIFLSGTPFISSFAPASGTYNTLVTIKGGNLSSINDVSFGKNQPGCDSFHIQSDSVVQAWVASGKTGKVYVYTNTSSDSIPGFTYTAPVVNNTQWQYLGNAGFSAGSARGINMAISKSNIPFVAFNDSSNGYKATVMKFTGSSWVNVGSTGSDGPSSNINIEIDSNNVPYISFVDSLNGANLSVKKFDGTNWVAVGTLGFAPLLGLSYGNYLALDGNNVPYIFSLNSTTAAKPISVFRFNGTAWINIGVAGVSSYGSCSIAINKSNNFPYIVFDDTTRLSPQSNPQATVRKFNGTNWITEGNANFTNAVNGIFYPSIKIGTDGIATVALQDDNGFERVSVYRFVGGNWSSNGTQYFSKSHSYYTSLDLDKNNLPVVAFIDNSYNRQGTVMNLDNAGLWQTTGARGFMPTIQLQSHALTINKANSPLVAFKDANNGNRASVMKLATALIGCGPNLVTWTGAAGTAWENPLNWNCGLVPTGNTAVVFNPGAVVSLGSNTTIDQLFLAPGVSLTVSTGVTLTILH